MLLDFVVQELRSNQDKHACIDCLYETRSIPRVLPFAQPPKQLRVDSVCVDDQADLKQPTFE